MFHLMKFMLIYMLMSNYILFNDIMNSYIFYVKREEHKYVANIPAVYKNSF